MMISIIVIPSGVPPTHDFDHDASQQRINLRGCWLHLPGGESSDKWGIEATSQKIMRYSLTFFVFLCKGQFEMHIWEQGAESILRFSMQTEGRRKDLEYTLDRRVRGLNKNDIRIGLKSTKNRDHKRLCKHRKWNETDAEGYAKYIKWDLKGSKISY